jgi:hypothetical protein
LSGVVFADLSRRCGVAFPNDAGRCMTALWLLPKVEGDGPTGREYGKMLADYRVRLMGLIALVKPTAIGFEAAINVMGRGSPAREYRTNESTIRVAYYLCGVTEEVAAASGVTAYECQISGMV